MQAKQWPWFPHNFWCCKEKNLKCGSMEIDTAFWIAVIQMLSTIIWMLSKEVWRYLCMPFLWWIPLVFLEELPESSSKHANQSLIFQFKSAIETQEALHCLSLAVVAEPWYLCFFPLHVGIKSKREQSVLEWVYLKWPVENAILLVSKQKRIASLCSKKKKECSRWTIGIRLSLRVGSTDSTRTTLICFVLKLNVVGCLPQYCVMRLLVSVNCVWIVEEWLVLTRSNSSSCCSWFF